MIGAVLVEAKCNFNLSGCLLTIEPTGLQTNSIIFKSRELLSDFRNGRLKKLL